MKQRIADLESKLDVMQKSIDAIKAQSSKPEVYNYGEDVDKPKPLTFKDMKPPAEYAGGRNVRGGCLFVFRLLACVLAFRLLACFSLAYLLVSTAFSALPP